MDGKTPLHITAIYHSKNTLGYLVSLNAIIDIEDEEGNTALFYATSESF
jgi:ankyrin repeat protein